MNACGFYRNRPLPSNTFHIITDNSSSIKRSNLRENRTMIEVSLLGGQETIYKSWILWNDSDICPNRGDPTSSGVINNCRPHQRERTVTGVDTTISCCDVTPARHRADWLAPGRNLIWLWWKVCQQHETTAERNDLVYERKSTVLYNGSSASMEHPRQPFPCQSTRQELVVIEESQFMWQLFVSSSVRIYTPLVDPTSQMRTLKNRCSILFIFVFLQFIHFTKNY